MTTLPLSNIKFSDLQSHFGDSDPVNLGDYFTNSANQYTYGIVDVPKNSTSISMSQLRGKQKTTQGLLRRRFTLNSTSASLNTTNFNAAFSNNLNTETTIVQDLTIPGVETTAFEYTGYIVPTIPGTYQFGITSDDGSDMALYYNNTWNIITSAYGYKAVEATPPLSGTVTLTEFNAVPIRIRFHEQGGGEGLNLFWTPPGQSRVAIPFTVLRCINPNPSYFPDPKVGPPLEIVKSYRIEDTSYDGLVSTYSPGFAYWPNAEFTTNLLNSTGFTVNNGPTLYVVARYPTAHHGKDVIKYGPSSTFFQSYSTHSWKFIM